MTHEQGHDLCLKRTIAAGEDADLDVGFGPGIAGEWEASKARLIEQGVLPMKSEPIAAGELVRCEECGARLWNERLPAEPVVTELVERLRGTRPLYDKTLLEAADTITRLEAEKQQYAALYMDRCEKWSDCQATIARLEAEWAAFFKQLAEAQATIARLDAEVRVCNDVCGERNATIARLEAENEKMLMMLGGSGECPQCAVLQSERDRLRGALERIAGQGSFGWPDEIARAALAGEKA
jgi:hypothetical protein